MFKNSDKENELGKITIDLNSIEKNYKLIKKKETKQIYKPKFLSIKNTS